MFRVTADQSRKALVPKNGRLVSAVLIQPLYSLQIIAKIFGLIYSLNIMETETAEKNNGPKLTLPISILLAALIISGTILYSNGLLGGSSDKQAVIGDAGGGTIEVSADDDPFIGPEDAKVEIIEFSDFQCPFCRSFWSNTLSQIKSQYIDAGKSVKFVYRDFPLSFHPMAQKYAEAAECGEDQGKFWEMHDKIFQEQEKLGTGTITTFTIDDVKRWAGQLGLNQSQFNQCLDSGKYSSEVQADFNDGSKAQVSGTPTFFINGQRLVGAQPFESFKAIIDEKLQR